MTDQAWRVVTFASALLTGVVLATAPVIAWSSCTATPNVSSACTSGRESLLASEGSGVLLVLAVPALLALVPVVLRSARASLAAAVALTVAALLAIASIGILLLPTVVFAWVAARSGTGAPAPSGRR